jgi:hypothetical protein
MSVPKKLRNTAVGERVYNTEAIDAFLAKAVKIEGNQSVSDIKTFSQSPIVPIPTELGQIANKAYADSIIGNFAIPNYASTETINRITTPGGTWVADRTGFVVCDMKGQSTAAQQYIWGFVKINAKMVYQNLALSYTSGNNLEIQDVFPVKAGDVVIVDTQGTANNKAVTCYFIPIAPQNNFNVYTNWGTLVANGTTTIPANTPTAYDILTAPEDGTYVFFVTNPGTLSSLKRILYGIIDLNGVHGNAQESIAGVLSSSNLSYGVIHLHMKKGQTCAAQINDIVAQSITWRRYANQVSVANAASAWVEYTGTNAVTPSSAMTLANAANTVLRYNPSLGIISLSLNRVNISTITDQTVLGTYSANVPLLSKVNFVEGDCHYPLYGFKIELRKNSRNIYFRNMVNNTSSVFNDVYFNDVIGYV